MSFNSRSFSAYSPMSSTTAVLALAIALAAPLLAEAADPLPVCSNGLSGLADLRRFDEVARNAQECWQSSKHPRMLWFAAWAASNLGRHAEALASVDEYLQHAKAAREPSYLRHEAKELRQRELALVGDVTLRLSTALERPLKGRLTAEFVGDPHRPTLEFSVEVEPGDAEVLSHKFDAGRWQFVLTIEGYEPAQVVTEIPAGIARVDLVAPSPRQESPPLLGQSPAVTTPAVLFDDSPKEFRPPAPPTDRRSVPSPGRRVDAALALTFGAAGLTLLATGGVLVHRTVSEPLEPNAGDAQPLILSSLRGAALIGSGTGATLLAVALGATSGRKSASRVRWTGLALGASMMAVGIPLFMTGSAQFRESIVEADFGTPEFQRIHSQRFSGALLSNGGVTMLAGAAISIVIHYLLERREARARNLREHRRANARHSPPVPS